MVLELRAVPLPVLVGQVQRRLVPPLAPEIRLRIEAGALAHAARHEREAEAGVLLPIPIGGHLRQAAEALLALAQRALGVLALGDVVEDRDLVLRRAVGGAHKRDGEVDPHGAAVATEIALLEVRRFQLAGPHALALVVRDVAVIRVRYFLHRAADQLALGKPEHFAQASVRPHELAVEAYVRDAGRCKLEGMPEPLLALAKRGLACALRSDVRDAGDDAVVALLARPAQERRVGG